MSRYEVVIVGGGPVGLAVAAILAARPAAADVRIRIFDGGARRHWAPADVDLRVYALSRATEGVLASAGAWPGIEGRRVSAYERMQVWEGASLRDAHRLCFDSADIGEPNLGHIVEDNLIRAALYDVLGRLPGVEIEFGSKLESVSFGERTIDLDFAGNTPRVNANLLIGADGAESKVRNAAGIPVIKRHYGQQAIVAHVVPERSHEKTAWQRFLSGGPLALLPLADGRCSIVWSVPEAQARHLVEAESRQFEAQLTQSSAATLGQLRLDSRRLALPLTARHATSYCRPRLALVGDAAHSVHPLAGQGVNLGLADAAELARQIAAAIEAGQDPGDVRVLRRFERARTGPNVLMIGALDCLDRLFRAPQVLSPLRSAGLSVVDRLPALKRRFIQHASGRSGVS